MIELIKRIEKKERIILFFAACFIVIQIYFDMKLPLYFAKILGLLNTGEADANSINNYWPAMFLCLILSFVFSVISIVMISKGTSTFIGELREKLFEKVLNLSSENIDKLTVSSLITRCTSDVQNIQNVLFTGIQAIVKVPIISVWVYYEISRYGIYWQLTVLVTIILCVIVIAASLILAAPFTTKVQNNTDELNRVTMEKLQGTDVIRSFNAQQEAGSRFSKINETLSLNTLKSQYPALIMMPGVNFIMNAMNTFVYIVCGLAIVSHPIEQQYADFSNQMTVIPYALQLMLAFMALVQVLFTFPRAKVSAVRINEILKTQAAVTDGPGALSTEKGTIEFKNVSFAFPGATKDFLNNVSFKCDEGKVIAIIGSIGSGKTLLIDLIMRFHDVKSGQILVDGIDVREYTLKQLRDKISLVQQRPVLFSGTIASNIAYGCEDKLADNDYIKSIGIFSGADEFVSNIPETYEGLIVRNGTNLSGGQRQRLSIARALAKPAEILIFDDSFSALDFKTDYTIRKNINERFSSSTKIIIGQRIGSIKNADTILVMDNGKIVGCGTHDELLKNCETYKQIAYSQLSKEEIGA